MKANFKVFNAPCFQSHNCILVDNYHHGNVVSNKPIAQIQLTRLKDEDSIGVWKIKKLKQP